VAGKIRLDRLLANLGYGSRKDVTAAVKLGAFILNGEAIHDASSQIDISQAANALFNGQALDPISPLTVLLHKPAGYICSTEEQGGMIYDLLPFRWRIRTPVLSAAGRLDKESTGLVLLTDDGQLLHKIISPKTHVEKEYRVTLRDELSGKEAEQFASGTFMLAKDPKPLKPAIWTADGPHSGTMILREGRYHQIRRMFGALGNHVEALHRVRLGGLTLDGLEEGAHRILNDSEVAAIFG